MKRTWLLGALGGLPLVLIAALLGCQGRDATPDQQPPPGSPWFADFTDAAGLDFVHDPGPQDSYFFPQITGSGAALFDFDGDGRLDLYLLNNGGPQGARNRLYRQGADGRFTDVSRGSGLDVPGYSMGVAVGDVNNDGRPDVLLTQYGGVKLFLNQGGGKFVDVTTEAGLRNPAWGTSAAFFDYDRDGWLDLVVVNYVDYDPTWPCSPPTGKQDYCAPRIFKGRLSRLFHNLGARADRPHGVGFADVTVASGLGRLPGPGLGVLCADFNGDGWPDVFIANDGAPNHLWVNQKNGTFAEEAVARGLAYNAMGLAEAGMGVALGDVDGDGLADLFVTHLTEEKHRLWRQGPRGLFLDHSVAAGLTAADGHGTGFGVVLADFDLDGALDLAIANGDVRKAPASANAALGPHWGLYAQRNQLLANDGGGHFRDVSASNPALCGEANVARGLAWGDVDGDGAVDLVVTTIGGRARLYKNVAVRRGHWLAVRAWDERLHRDAYGAEVRLRAGGKTWVRGINPASSFLCSSAAVAHFGLGAAERVEWIEVVWPDGSRERFDGCGVDRPVRLVKGKGSKVR